MELTHPHSASDSAFSRGEVASWVETFGRVGLAAKSAIYLMIGSLALQGAFGGGKGTPDSQSALESFAAQPFGRTMLVALGIGLVCYAIWRLVETFVTPRDKEELPAHITQRAGRFASGVIHAGLALAAFRMGVAGQSGGAGSDSSAQGMTAMLMEQPFGKWLVVLAGVCLLGTAISQFYEAIAEKYKSQFSLDDAAGKVRRWIHLAAKAGLSARGLVFLITGGFLVYAGLSGDAGEARGMSGALEALRAQAFGPWLFSAVAVGLFCYGIYCAVRARYGHIGNGRDSA